MNATHIILAVFAKVIFHKKRSNGHSHVAIDVRDAVFPSLWLLLPSVEDGIELLFQVLKTLIQIIQTVSDESPEKVVG